MTRIQSILETKEVAEYLAKRNLTAQYKKAKAFLLAGNMLQVRFKQRMPKSSGIWYFRINKQFRALCVFQQDGDLVVFEIDNHQ